MMDDDEMEDEGGIEVVLIKCSNGHSFATLAKPGKTKCPRCGEEVELVEVEP